MKFPKDSYLESLLKRISILETENEKLLKERCYICRPDTEGVSEEGCKDCDERSDMHHTIEEFQANNEELKNQSLEKDTYIQSLEDRLAEAKVEVECLLSRETAEKTAEMKKMKKQINRWKRAASQKIKSLEKELEDWDEELRTPYHWPI